MDSALVFNTVFKMKSYTSQEIQEKSLLINNKKIGIVSPVRRINKKNIIFITVFCKITYF